MADSKNAPNTSGPKLEKVRELSLPTAVLALAYEPDSKQLYAACLDGSVIEVNPESGAIRPLSRHTSYASGIACVTGSPWLLSAGYDGMLHWIHRVDASTAHREKAHDFWSWNLAVSPNGQRAASVTGQYLAGGYKYEPAPEREPSVRVYDIPNRRLLHSFSHLPPVQSVAISPDSRLVAAANLMGEVRIWEMESGQPVAQFNTSDFTSWGIIKTHHYIGGVFALRFSPDGAHLYLCGMGPMHDPMAGNGAQRWQRFDWRTGKKTAEIDSSEAGQGLMESLAFHTSRPLFAMGGRLVQGQWNLALFDSNTGKKVFSTDAKHRITSLQFEPSSDRLFIGKAKGQEKKKDGRWPDFGLIEIHQLRT